MKPSKTELKRNITTAMIREHGEGLIRFFGLDPNLVDPIDLCKKLRRLENKAHEITTQLCNGFPELDHESQEDHTAELEIKLCRIEGKVQGLLESYQRPRQFKKNQRYIYKPRPPRICPKTRYRNYRILRGTRRGLSTSRLGRFWHYCSRSNERH
jgi:hypothetical protein